MTGEDRYLEGAERAREYLRDHMRFFDTDENIVYWYHGIDVERRPARRRSSPRSSATTTTRFPMYEQIYALAGPTQTYRITGDPRILQRHREARSGCSTASTSIAAKGGYFSHLDPITLDPQEPVARPERGKKNWNSVGDHAPAYLINLYLATGEPKYADFLEYTVDTIAERFPDYDNSPFVKERFHEDWSQRSGRGAGSRTARWWATTSRSPGT